MGINPTQFFDDVITPTLDCMGRIIDKRMSSDESKCIMLGTACAESQLTFLRQFNSGPAIGFYQMEPATYADHIKYCERKGEEFKSKVIYCIYQEERKDFPHGSQLIYNLRLQTVFARLHYWRVTEPIPEATPLQAAYWKKFYNSVHGRGTVQHYINSFPISV